MEAGETRRDRREAEAEILLFPDGTVIKGSIGATILRALQENGVPIASSCGGHGVCGECSIRFVDRPPVPTRAELEHIDPEQISSGWRLACSHPLSGRTQIEIHAAAGELDHKARRDTSVSAGGVDPAVVVRTVSLSAPSRDDPRSAVGRLWEALGEEPRVPLCVLRLLAGLPRSEPADVSIVEHRDRLIDACAAGGVRICGLAIDVGTTTLAVYLFDLATGRQLAVAASRNPQQQFGADVISRIAHVRRLKSEGLAALHTAVVDGLNGLIDRVVAKASVASESIYTATVVGNPTMLHLLLAVDPRGIDVSPYVPAFKHAVSFRAEDVGLATNPLAVIETLPAVSAYVGADVVAGMLATDLLESEGTTLFLDVGTNGEVVLARNGRLIACSTAAGPAFEGASIVEGMLALDGAIESVRVREGDIECDVIGDAAPTGICGSGLVSAVAELRSAGVIDASGRFQSPDSLLSDRLEGTGKTARFRLTGDSESVCLHQSDVREFQLAKAAVRAGIEVLSKHASLPADKLDSVLVGGAFSTHLSGEHLVTSGLLPKINPSRIRLVGNTAGQGAKRVLLDRGLMECMHRVVESVEYIELSGDRQFSDLYVQQIRFPTRGDDRANRPS